MFNCEYKNLNLIDLNQFLNCIHIIFNVLYKFEPLLIILDKIIKNYFIFTF